MVEQRQCSLCLAVEGEMEPMGGPRGTFWICKDRDGCKGRAKAMEIAQRGQVVRPALEKEPDAVDGLFAACVDHAELTIEDLAQCYVGRTVQLIFEGWNIFSKPPTPFTAAVGVLKGVVQGWLVFSTEAGSRFVPLSRVTNLEALPSEKPREEA